MQPQFYRSSDGTWYCWSWLDRERQLIAIGDSKQQAEANWREAIKRLSK